MLLSLATGIFFFTWVVTGLSLSLGLLILIIGIPLTVLFFGSVRGLALLEGRLVEALLGERMPRRPRYTDRSRTWLQRIGDMFTDGRTWLTLLYFVLMLPLGVIYFTIAVTLLSLSLGFIWAPVAALFSGDIPGVYVDGVNVLPMAASPLVGIVIAAVGVLLLLTMHLARGVGKLHGRSPRTCWCGCAGAQASVGANLGWHDRSDAGIHGRAPTKVGIYQGLVTPLFAATG